MGKPRKAGRHLYLEEETLNGYLKPVPVPDRIGRVNAKLRSKSPNTRELYGLQKVPKDYTNTNGARFG